MARDFAKGSVIKEFSAIGNKNIAFKIVSSTLEGLHDDFPKNY